MIDFQFFWMMSFFLGLVALLGCFLWGLHRPGIQSYLWILFGFALSLVMAVGVPLFLASHVVYQ